jgi:hypothetical protein
MYFFPIISLYFQRLCGKESANNFFIKKPLDNTIYILYHKTRRQEKLRQNLKLMAGSWIGSRVPTTPAPKELAAQSQFPSTAIKTWVFLGSGYSRRPAYMTRRYDNDL